MNGQVLKYSSGVLFWGLGLGDFKTAVFASDMILMITEAEEHKMYLEIKERFKNEKGQFIFIELNEKAVENFVMYRLKNGTELGKKIYKLQEPNGSYAFFDYSKEVPVYYFSGKTFYKEEEIATGKITEFYRYRIKGPADMERVKEELKILFEMLRNPKAS